MPQRKAFIPGENALGCNQFQEASCLAQFCRLFNHKRIRKDCFRKRKETSQGNYLGRIHCKKDS